VSTKKKESIQDDQTVVEDTTVIVTETVVEENTVIVEAPVVVKNKKPVYINGRVTGCSLLRVRKGANAKAEVIKEVHKGTTVKVDIEGSTESFYRVFIDGKEGFCMKQFIEI